MHTMSLDVGAHLKSVRQMYGLSQRELAKRAGVTKRLDFPDRAEPSESLGKFAQEGTGRHPDGTRGFFTLDLAGKPQVFFPRDDLADIGSGAVEVPVSSADAWASAACRYCMSAMRPMPTRAMKC